MREEQEVTTSLKGCGGKGKKLLRQSRADSEACDDNRQDKLLCGRNGTVDLRPGGYCLPALKLELWGRFSLQRWRNAPAGETVWETLPTPMILCAALGEPPHAYTTD